MFKTGFYGLRTMVAEFKQVMDAMLSDVLFILVIS